jgi:hypothetical protein
MAEYWVQRLPVQEGMVDDPPVFTGFCEGSKTKAPPGTVFDHQDLYEDELLGFDPKTGVPIEGSVLEQWFRFEEPPDLVEEAARPWAREVERALSMYEGEDAEDDDDDDE